MDGYFDTEFRKLVQAIKHGTNNNSNNNNENTNIYSNNSWHDGSLSQTHRPRSRCANTKN